MTLKAAPAKRPRTGAHRRWSNHALTALMLVIGVVWAAPTVWVVWASLHPTGSDAPVVTLRFFQQVFTDYGFLPNLINSVTTTFLSTGLAVLIGTPAAYALARIPFRRKEAVTFGLLVTRMAPPMLIALPLFLLARQLNVYDTVWLLILIYTAVNLSWVVFMMRSYFSDIPAELDEAAAVDGASRWRTYWSVVLPIARPGLVATATFCFITSWNEYMFAVALTSVRAITLPASLTSFLTVHGLLMGPMAAASVTVIVPIMVLALWMQKHLVRGMAMGAVK
jgi:ABC-type glycerol-3-phosphate transport system permease component